MGCELKSIRTVLKCLKLTSDVSEYFWTLEGSIRSTLFIVEILEHEEKHLNLFHTQTLRLLTAMHLIPKEWQFFYIHSSPN